VADVIVQVYLYGRWYASFAEVRGMAVVVVRRRGLRSRVLVVSVVVGMIVGMIVGMVVRVVMRVVMRVAMRSHVSVG
jgi:hypothetical protein